jgi:hypothetical protein
MKGKSQRFAVIFLGVMIFLSSGCRTSSSDDQASAEPDIFIVGYTLNRSNVAVPCIWKNGARTDLSILADKDGAAYSIFTLSR